MAKKKTTSSRSGRVPKLAAAIEIVTEEAPSVKLPLSVFPTNHTLSAKKRALLPRVGDLTERLSEIIDLPAAALQETANYCHQEGILLQGATVKDCLVHYLIAHSLRGNDTALAQLWNRIDGRPVQKTEVDIHKRVEAIVLMKDLDLDLETRKTILCAIRKHKKADVDD